LVTLLRDGFGFHPSSRDITFSFHVDGSEVEWSMGLALSLHAQERDDDEKNRGLASSSIQQSSHGDNCSKNLENNIVEKECYYDTNNGHIERDLNQQQQPNSQINKTCNNPHSTYNDRISSIS
jgi:hypothetical protein